MRSNCDFSTLKCSSLVDLTIVLKWVYTVLPLTNNIDAPKIV